MTSHDREFMNRIVTKIAEIDGGEITAYSGNYDFYERERAIREANREAAYARQQAMLAKEQRFIERFAAHAAKAAQVQSRVKALEKIEKIELPKKRRVVEVRLPAAAALRRAGRGARGRVTRPTARRVVYDGLNLTIRRGERWCVMGKNGAGKSTLLKMVAGALAPDAGEVQLGASLKMGYFAQQALDLLDPGPDDLRSSCEKDFPHESIGALRNLLGAFQFSGDDIDKKIRALSGGEKTRLVMARMLLDPPNFLVLDEPTNHLDLATKEMLLDALTDFDGTMLFVSHDRAFLRGLSNRVLELGGESGTGRRAARLPGLVRRIRGAHRARSARHSRLIAVTRARLAPAALFRLSLRRRRRACLRRLDQIADLRPPQHDALPVDLVPRLVPVLCRHSASSIRVTPTWSNHALYRVSRPGRSLFVAAVSRATMTGRSFH